MANTNEPRGLWPAALRAPIHYYTKGATAIYPGDLLAMQSGGGVTVAAASGTQLIGVAAAYRSAATTDKVPVYDDPDQQFYIQDRGSGSTALAATSVGNNFRVTATVGNATLLKSQHVLNNLSTPAAASGELRLLGFHPSDSVGNYVRCRVVINAHHWAKKTSGI